MRKLITRFALLLTALSLGVLALMPAAASAHHVDGHEQGPPDRTSERTTEDDDADGKPNCPDPAGDEDNEHPSGRDRHCETGAAGDQGGARSDPDDDGRGPDRSNGGVDQPDGEGGEDQLDQDGNNGCGNDDDFEDDNEGWCGKPDREESETGGELPQNEEEVTLPDEQRDDEEATADVGGISETRETTEVVVGSDEVDAAPAETAVMGIQFERAPTASSAPDAAGDAIATAPNTLPRTGIPAGVLALTGVALATVGYGLRRIA